MQNYLQEIPVINLINRQPLEPTRTLPSFFYCHYGSFPPTYNLILKQYKYYLAFPPCLCKTVAKIMHKDLGLQFWEAFSEKP